MSSRAELSPLHISGSPVERVRNTKFLCVHITEILSWALNTTHLSKRAQQRMHFLRRLKQVGIRSSILTTFYRASVESVLTACITSWYGSSREADRKMLQWVMRMAEKAIGVFLPSLEDIYIERCRRKALCIVRDSSHPSHGLFDVLPSGRRYHSL